MANPREVLIDYTNHRGERAVRRIEPIDIAFHSTDWHPEPQWLIEAIDLERPGQPARWFALSCVHSWRPVEKWRGMLMDFVDGVALLPVDPEADARVEAALRAADARRTSSPIDPSDPVAVGHALTALRRGAYTEEAWPACPDCDGTRVADPVGACGTCGGFGTVAPSVVTVAPAANADSADHQPDLVTPAGVLDPTCPTCGTLVEADGSTCGDCWAREGGT